MSLLSQLPINTRRCRFPGHSRFGFPLAFLKMANARQYYTATLLARREYKNFHYVKLLYDLKFSEEAIAREEDVSIVELVPYTYTSEFTCNAFVLLFRSYWTFSRI